MTLLALTLLFSQHTKEFKLPANLLSSICYVESHYNPNALHKDDGDSNSVGLCQVKLKTAKWLGFKGNEKQLLKPEINAYYAAKYLQYLLKRYHGNITKAIIAYNRGNAGTLTRTSYSDKVYRRLKEERINEYANHSKHNDIAYRF